MKTKFHYLLAVLALLAGPNRARAQELFDTNDTPAQKAQILTYRAYLRAQSGRFEAAAADLKQVIAINPADPVPWYLLTPLLARTGSAAEYQTHCQAMLDRFDKTTDAETAERTAKSCLLLPGAVGAEDLARAAKLAANSVALGKGSPWFHWFQFTKGLGEYRQGRYKDAVKSMTLAQEESVRSRDGARDMCNADTWFVSAMACHQLKQPGKAGAALARGHEIAQAKLPKLDSGQLGEAWLDVLMTYTFMHEADELIHGGAGIDQQTSPAK